MTPAELASVLADAAPAPVDVRLAADPSRADFVCAAALRARVPDRRRFAERLAELLLGCDEVAEVRVAGPGFLDIRVTDAALVRAADSLLDRAPAVAQVGPVGAWAALAREAGPDVALLVRALDPGADPARVDRERVLRRTQDNPVFRVLHAYAHAALIERSPSPPDRGAQTARRPVRVRVAEVAGPACDTRFRTGRRLSGLADAFLALVARADAAPLAAPVRAALGRDLGRLGIEPPHRI